MNANRGDDGSAILLHGQSVLFGGAEGNLLRAVVWRPLAPKMTLTLHGRGEVHPRAIGRPTRGSAPTIWPYWYWREPALERDELAQRPLALAVHHDHKS